MGSPPPNEMWLFLMSGDAAQVLHQIQNHTLATEQRTRIVANHRQHLAVVHPHSIKDLRLTHDFKARLRRGAPV